MKYFKLTIAALVLAGTLTLAPDGTYVNGVPTLAPDGTYVVGVPTLAPDGTYVGVERRGNTSERKNRRSNESMDRRRR